MDPAVFRDERRVLHERLEIVIDEAPEPQVDQQLVHRRVPDPLADPERGAVHAIGDRRRREGVDRAEAAVVVTVVVELHFPPAYHVSSDERQ